MSENNESAPLSEVEISEGDASGYSDQDVLDKTIDIIEQERNDIRTIIQSSLSVSGLLLTISLGALYFSYSSDSIVITPIQTKEALFISAFCLTVSIFINILALRISEKRYTKWSTIALLLSILGLFYGMGAFAWDQANIDSQLNTIKEVITFQIQSATKNTIPSIFSNLSNISGLPNFNESV
jgi:hypothetical protein